MPQTKALSRSEKTKKFLEAKPEVDKLISRHGLEAVSYVVNRVVEKDRLQKKLKRELAEKKRASREEIEKIERQLGNLE